LEEQELKDLKDVLEKVKPYVTAQIHTELFKKLREAVKKYNLKIEDIEKIAWEVVKR